MVLEKQITTRIIHFHAISDAIPGSRHPCQHSRHGMRRSASNGRGTGTLHANGSYSPVHPRLCRAFPDLAAFCLTTGQMRSPPHHRFTGRMTSSPPARDRSPLARPDSLPLPPGKVRAPPAESLQGWGPAPNSASEMVPVWQEGKPKFSPGSGARLSSSGGMSSPIPVCPVVGEPETSYFHYNPWYATTFLPCAVYNGSM